MADRAEGRARGVTNAHGIIIAGREDNVVWGFLLVGLGVIFLLIQLGQLSWHDWSQWWPYLVILGGVGQLATLSSPKRIGSGVAHIGMGLWFLIVTHHWHGLGWEQTWPLALVAIGLGMVTRAIATVFMVRSKEDGHVEID